jgi:hypothetical protein
MLLCGSHGKYFVVTQNKDKEENGNTVCTTLEYAISRCVLYYSAYLIGLDASLL